MIPQTGDKQHYVSCRWTLWRLCPCLWLRLITADSRASTLRVLSVPTSSCLDQSLRYKYTPILTLVYPGGNVTWPLPSILPLVQINGTEEADYAKKALFSRHPEMIDWPSDHNWFFAKFKITQVFLLLLLLVLLLLYHYYYQSCCWYHIKLHVVTTITTNANSLVANTTMLQLL